MVKRADIEGVFARAGTSPAPTLYGPVEPLRRRVGAGLVPALANRNPLINADRRTCHIMIQCLALSIHYTRNASQLILYQKRVMYGNLCCERQQIMPQGRKGPPQESIDSILLAMSRRDDIDPTTFSHYLD